MQCVERSILAPLRNHTFLSLYEINQAIKTKLLELNNRPMKRIEISRQTLFEQTERTALRPLPAVRFEMQEWRYAKVHRVLPLKLRVAFYSSKLFRSI